MGVLSFPANNHICKSYKPQFKVISFAMLSLSEYETSLYTKDMSTRGSDRTQLIIHLYF